MSDPKELREKLRWIAEELEKDLERTQFKGRTLVLKIKLHSYEVFTRQFQPPKAVHKADDLYHFGLQMFQKIEKEIPGLKLRLMGLRCTHLVSMKKGDKDFFGRARQQSRGSREASENPKAAVELDADGWQKWPDEEFETAARLEQQDEMEELERMSQEHTDSPLIDGNEDDDGERKAFEVRKHDNGFAWRLLLEEERAQAEEEERARKPPLEQWSCPICSVPQAADERLFNEHIDACLSRQTIKEIVHTADTSTPAKSSKPLPPSTSKRKRGRPRAGSQDHPEPEKRPKKTFFT